MIIIHVFDHFMLYLIYKPIQELTLYSSTDDVLKLWYC